MFSFSFFSHALAMLALGAALGFFGGLFGIGGGIIAIPFMVLALGMDQSLAQGTALVLMVPNLLVAWWRYQQRHPVPGRAILSIALSATLTTALLAHYATGLDTHVLSLLFSLFLSALAVQLLRTRRQQPHTPRPLNLARLPWVGLLGGSSMGLLGIGGGLIASPLLSGWLGQKQSTAQGLALALVTPSALVALCSYSHAQRVDWPLGLLMALGGLCTVSPGVTLAHRLPEAKLRTAFAGLLLIAALWLGGRLLA